MVCRSMSASALQNCATSDARRWSGLSSLPCRPDGTAPSCMYMECSSVAKARRHMTSMDSDSHFRAASATDMQANTKSAHCTLLVKAAVSLLMMEE